MGYSLYMYGIKPGPVRDAHEANVAWAARHAQNKSTFEEQFRDPAKPDDLSYFGCNIYTMSVLRDLMHRMGVAQGGSPTGNDDLVSLRTLSSNDGERVTRDQIVRTLALIDNLSAFERASAFGKTEDEFGASMNSFQMLFNDWVAWLRLVVEHADGFGVY